jgi:CBS domain-containing protein
VLTLPTSATVGQALRDLAAADVLAAPAVDAASGDYAGWVSCGNLLRQLLRALYPRVLDPELLAEDDVAAFLARDADDVDRGGREKNAEHDAAAIDARPSSPSSRPSERRNGGTAPDEKEKPRARSVLDELVRDAAAELESAWRRVVRVGDDGDACFDAFADTTLLDLLSRGLCNRALCDKRRGDFEPCHRIVVYGEKRMAGRKARGKEETTSEKSATSWRTVVSQLDALELMTRDADALGAFPRVQTMESLGFARAHGPPGVVAVSEDLPAFACFALMNNCDVSGVPVLDASRRRLVDTVSVSDVRLFDSAESLADLAAPIGAFREKRKRRRRSGGRGGGGSPRRRERPSSYLPARRCWRRCARWWKTGRTGCTSATNRAPRRGACARARTSRAYSPWTRTARRGGCA